MLRRSVLALAMFLVLPHGAGAQDSSFTIGVSLPLSGDAGECGVAVRNAIEMARSEEPNRFKNIKFIYEDNRYDAKTALTTVQKLLDIDRARLLFVWGDVAASTAVPFTERRRVPNVAVLTDPVPVRGSRYALRFLNSYDEYGGAMLAYLRSQGLRRIGIITVDDPYYVTMIEGMRRQLLANETIEVVANHRRDEADFKVSIAKIKKLPIDVLGVYLEPGQVSAFYRQARSIDLKLATFGADTFESQLEIRDAQGAMNGAVYAHNSVAPSFRARYIKRYGNDAQIAYGANAYEFALLAADLFGNVTGKVLSSEEIVATLASAPRRDGVTGVFQAVMREGEAPYFKFPIVVKQIRGEEIIVVGQN